MHLINMHVHVTKIMPKLLSTFKQWFEEKCTIYRYISYYLFGYSRRYYYGYVNVGSLRRYALNLLIILYVRHGQSYPAYLIYQNHAANCDIANNECKCTG